MPTSPIPHKEESPENKASEEEFREKPSPLPNTENEDVPKYPTETPTNQQLEDNQKKPQEPQEERLIEKLFPYFGPVLLFSIFRMIQWSDDDTTEPSKSLKEPTSADASSSPPSASLFATTFGFADDPKVEHEGFLSRVGFFGDCLVIIAVVAAVCLWRASNKVEGGRMRG